MVTFTGPKTTVLVGEESTWGSATTVTTTLGLIQRVTINNAREVITSHGLGSRNVIAVGGGKYDGSGSVEFQLQHGRPLEYMVYGGTTTHATSTDDYTHTFVFSNSLPSFTMEIGGEDGTTDLVHTLSGVIFHSPKLSLDLDGVLVMSCDFVFKNLTNTTSATAAVVDSIKPLTGIQCSISSGSAMAQVQSVELNLSSNASKSWGLGSALPVAGASQMLDVAVSGTLTHNTATELELLLGGTTAATDEPTAITYTFTGNNGVTLGSGRNEISIAITSAQMDGYSIEVGNEFATSNFSAKGILGAGTFVDNVSDTAW